MVSKISLRMTLNRLEMCVSNNNIADAKTSDHSFGETLPYFSEELVGVSFSLVNRSYMHLFERP